MIQELLDMADGKIAYEFSYKRLEQIRGFLCHLAMTYETLTPFLKGLHLTLASYLPHRDSEGWKLSDKKWLDHIKKHVKEGKLSEEEGKAAIEEDLQSQAPEVEWYVYLQEQLDKGELSKDEAQAALDARVPEGDPPPKTIKGVACFFQDLRALQELLSADLPPKVSIRCWLILQILYGFCRCIRKRI